MLKLMTIVESQYDYGCIMAFPEKFISDKILGFGRNLIPENILYKENDSFGYENEIHTTIKYGLINPYNEAQMRQLLHHVTPFNIEVGGLSIFENEKFDVVKFEVDGKELRKLNEMFCKLPHHDSYPDYKPHMTLAYVKKGHGKNFVKESFRKTKIPISTIVYSHKGNKMYYDINTRKMNESKDAPTYRMIGKLDAYDNVRMPKGQSGHAMHKHYGWETEPKKFSYWPKEARIVWWQPQDDDTYQRVEDFLIRQGYPVKYHALFTGDRLKNALTEYKKSVRVSESLEYPPVILGAINAAHEVEAVNGNSEESRHLPKYKSWLRWRFTPEIGYLTWWEPPTDMDRTMVRDYLERHGYNVLRSRVLTQRLEENLIMEVTQQQADAALAFLEEKVKTGPFKGKVYLAGGPVRDMIRGKTPKDLDISVIGDGLRGGLNFAIWLAKQMGNYKGPAVYPPQFNFPAHIKLDHYGAPDFSPIANDPALVTAKDEYDDYYSSFSNPVLFPKFGTAKVFLQGTYNGVNLSGMDVEAVAARKEVYTPGSRKPQVFPGTLKDDVFRRDFRANSLMMDLTTGKILDLTGEGINDIKKGILVTTSDPEVIFKEDPLRMMRAVRFMVQKGFEISPETKENIRKNAAWLKTISRERVRDELDKMLVTANPTEAIRELRDLGLLPYIAPELQQAVGMTQNVHHKHDVFDHTMEVLKNTKPELVQRLMALFHDIGKVATRSETPSGVHFYGHEKAGADMVEKILHNLKYPSDIINAVKKGVSNHMRLKQGGDTAINLSDKALRKFKLDLGDNLENILDVIHADNIAHADASAMPNQISNVRQRLKMLNIQVKKPVLPVNGNDLINMGVPNGPLRGKILSAVTDAWFENPNITRDDALAIVRKMI